MNLSVGSIDNQFICQMAHCVYSQQYRDDLTCCIQYCRSPLQSLYFDILWTTEWWTAIKHLDYVGFSIYNTQFIIEHCHNILTAFNVWTCHQLWTALEWIITHLKDRFNDCLMHLRLLEGTLARKNTYVFSCE